MNNQLNRVGNIEKLGASSEPINLNPLTSTNVERLKVKFIPENESFSDFLIKNLISELRLNLKESGDILVSWVNAYYKWKFQNNETDSIHPDESGMHMTGNVRSLLNLAFDVYCLILEGAFPNDLRKRLRLNKEFQGVLYEIQVASIVVRANFSISYTDPQLYNDMGKKCEFIAIHKVTKEKIGFETKSKHFRGILHFNEGNTPDNIKPSFLGRLMNEAKEQRPKELPFIIFIDENIPPNKDVINEGIPYLDEHINFFESDYRRYIVDKERCPYNYLIITNYSDYYFSDELVPDKGYVKMISSEYPMNMMQNDALMFQDLLSSIARYSNAINKITEEINKCY
ncbi:hypothetical protein [Paenibacillus sp. MMS18-CY102]|uniref:hypothetical protein n=1 Tax=Paenibacillus sp. MMS18-CY102 TaxID=2682849 RepID=UPI0013661E1D|nr:hypothetical protein [Paenibacillus sp. MMS18-CY102]MWC31023.1 hypothetical protein [Paenibacillus sp. MMS18-CY102]